LFIIFADKLIGVEGSRLQRDERSGETTQWRKAARGLTARPAESEATWNGNQLLTRATMFAKTAILKHPYILQLAIFPYEGKLRVPYWHLDLFVRVL
jgi:hypothetical protein